jgi:FtsP/CotA-like multicopper oxidase with cupredoxin domain
MTRPARLLAGVGHIFIAALVIAGVASSALAQSVAGDWVTTDFGPRPVPLIFTVTGSTLSGTAGPNNLPITDGRVDANTVTFTVSAAGGGRIVTFVGHLTSDTISFTRSVTSRDAASATGTGIFGANGPMAFTARRGTIASAAEATGATNLPAVSSLERVAANDNRIAAGTLSGGVLAVRLEARVGAWFPDGDGNPGVAVTAFAVEGGPLQVPGPLIRVPEGTEVRVAIRNRLGEPLAMHGLYTRPARQESSDVVIPPGESREVAVQVGQPGTYYYRGATTAGPNGQRSPVDEQLLGAIVVDPRDGAPSDRILVIGGWNNGAPQGSPERRFRLVINGLSWPHTERLTYAVGETVRMRLINASGAVHPMHLHGFYFNVDSRGNEGEDVVFPTGSSSRLVVTERMVAGSTFTLTWKPTRPGNWLFHCHDNVHLDYGGPLDGSPARTPGAHQHVDNHALEMMAGLVMGIEVTGPSAEAPEPTSPRRQLRLVARVDEGGTDAEPAFGYALDAENGAAARPPYLPGPLLLLKRGEPVNITVANQLQEPTAVHWHGIEQLLRWRRRIRRRQPAYRTPRSAWRILPGAVHAATLGDVHLSHAP